MESYKKFSWQDLSEFEVKNGFVYINLSGELLSEQSKVNQLLFQDYPKKKLEIYGNYSISIGEDKLYMLDIIGELEVYFNSITKNSRIEFIRFDRKGNLEIVIDTIPKIKIEMNIEESGSFGEEWQYDYEKGYIVF